MERKREYLDALIRSQQAYFDKLTELDTTEQQLVNLTEEFISYIRERVLWIRTGKPLTADFSISDSDLWLVQPDQWLSVAGRLWSDFREAPNLFAAAVLMFAGLFAVRRRLRRKIQDLGQLAARRNCTHFRLTLRAAAFTLLVSLLGPAATWFLAWRLAPSPDGTDLGNAVASGLWVLASAFFPVELLRQICRRQGLAESHFGWPLSTMRTLRANLRQLMTVGMPLVFVTSVLHASDPEHGYDVLERIGFILACVLASLFLSRVLHPSTGVLQEYVAFHPNGWIDRLKFVWYWLGVASPLALAAMAFFGYYYTAQQLALRLLFTISLIVLLVTVRAFLLRLLLVHRRHLSIRQAQERRAAALAAAAQGTGGAAVSRPVIPVEEETVDLAHLSSQTQRIVTTLDRGRRAGRHLGDLGRRRAGLEHPRPLAVVVDRRAVHGKHDQCRGRNGLGDPRHRPAGHDGRSAAGLGDRGHHHRRLSQHPRPAGDRRAAAAAAGNVGPLRRHDPGQLCHHPDRRGHGRRHAWGCVGTRSSGWPPP